MRTVFRVDPALPAGLMKSYQIAAPLQTHFRPATCAEVDCRALAAGWTTKVDVSTGLGQEQARYIHDLSGRAFTFEHVGFIVTFTFPAGQRCFTPHQVPLERDPVYVVRGGDWRGDPRGETPVQRTADDWVDDFAEHQDRLITRLNQG